MNKPIDLDKYLSITQINLFNYYTEIINSLYQTEGIWNNGGKRWVYEYKYRLASKTICGLYIKENVLGLMIIFGQKERDKVEDIKNQLSLKTINEYDQATTFHDGKWVMFIIDNENQIDDIKLLLNIKRKFRKEN